MRKIITLFGLFFLIGCTSAQKSISHRPPNHDGAPYVISKSIHPVTNKITVKVDGEQIIKDRLSLWDGSGEFFAKHEGHKFRVSCKGELDTTCKAYVDGEYAGEI